MEGFPKLSLDMYSSYGEHYNKMKDYKFVKPNYNIYFCTAKDILDYISSSSLKDTSEKYLFHGFLKKYFPLIESLSSIGTKTDKKNEYESIIRQKLEVCEMQKKLQNEDYFEDSKECRPDTLIYRNRIKPNSINIFKIIKEFE